MWTSKSNSRAQAGGDNLLLIMAEITTVAAIFFSLILIKITGTCAAVTGPVLTSFPDQISLGLTDTLDVNCTLSLDDWPGVAALISLTVSRNISQAGWSELAIISDFSSGQVNVMTTETVTANGWFDEDSSALISLLWDYPTVHQEGVYKCEADGFDSFGHIVQMSTQVQVSAHSPALSDWQDKVIELSKGMKVLEEQTKQSESERKALQLSVMELTNEKLNAFSQAFEASFEYRNHTYGLSRDAFWDIHLSLAVCRIYGGYLAEIDDSDEHSAIHTFLQSVYSFYIYAVYIGGSDEAEEGTWILPSRKPLSFVVWDTDEPDNLDYQDCLFMTRGNGLMIEYQCQSDKPAPNTRFLCEIPSL